LIEIKVRRLSFAVPLGANGPTLRTVTKLGGGVELTMP
jgi:hypothetical protein